MEVNLDLTKIIVAIVGLVGAAGGGQAYFAGEYRAETRERANAAVEKSERALSRAAQANVTCNDLERFANGLVRVLNLSLDETAPPSGPQREAHARFVREATSVVNGLGCSRNP